MPKKRIKDLTPEQREIHDREILERRLFRSLVTRVKNNCAEYGLRETKLQLEFLRTHPNTPLPSPLNYENTLSAFEAGILAYSNGTVK